MVMYMPNGNGRNPNTVVSPAGPAGTQSIDFSVAVPHEPNSFVTQSSTAPSGAGEAAAEANSRIVITPVAPTETQPRTSSMAFLSDIFHTTLMAAVDAAENAAAIAEARVREEQEARAAQELLEEEIERRIFQSVVAKAKHNLADQAGSAASATTTPSSPDNETSFDNIFATSLTLEKRDEAIDNLTEKQLINLMVAGNERIKRIDDEVRKRRDLFAHQRTEISNLKRLSFVYHDKVYNYRFSKSPQHSRLISHTAPSFFSPIDYLKNLDQKQIENHSNYYIVWSDDTGLYTVSLDTFIEQYVYPQLLKEYRMFNGLREDEDIPEQVFNDICNNVTPENIQRIQNKMEEWGIDHYGYITKEQKNSLLPPFIVSNMHAIATSTVSVAALSLSPITAIFANNVAITLLVYFAHPQLATLNYQKNQQGHTPSDEQNEILAKDTKVLTGQAFVSSMASTMIMCPNFHQWVGWVDGPVAAIWLAAIPWYGHLVAALAIGLVISAAVTAIAYCSQTENNKYTGTQLAKVAAIGFVAGALMYPAFLLSAIAPMSTFVSISLEYLINLGMMAALSINIGDRLSAKSSATSKPFTVRASHAVAPRPHSVPSLSTIENATVVSPLGSAPGQQSNIMQSLRDSDDVDVGSRNTVTSFAAAANG